MFDQSLMPAPPGKPWMFSVSTLLQLGVVGVALVWPLLKIEALPAPKLEACACRPPARAVTIVDTKTVRSTASRSTGGLTVRAAARPFVAPSSIPRGVPVVIDDPGTIEFSSASMGSGVPSGSGIPGGWDLGSPGVAAAPPAPPKVEPPPQAPRPKPRVYQVGGQVRPPRLIHEVRPAYPPLARQARIAGTVKLAAVIAVDGSVQALRVVSGHPLLVQAALDAVRQWRYEPTLLNNSPVEVAFTVDVNFNLH